MEYSSQLYKNPRGIGCNHCHGLNGEGKLVANYIHKKKKKDFRGPAINSIKYDDFEKALNGPKKGMPRYYLTQAEIKALFFIYKR
jgi:mono/diheme cytochrome c family protein